ncbi:hypothetical protein B0H11DRAFT_2028349 [Mycena galericulata]|nr:hypothetical protein B0H11DRAFT_2028349 [Mycena galericulata]
MSHKNVVRLTAEERAICRVRYRQVATYMDPGPQPRTYNDRICQAIAGHWKNGAKLERGTEYAELLFPFGNKRAVCRHIVNKGIPEDVDGDREIALEWVETQPATHRAEILMLLGLADKDAKVESDAEVDVKNEPGDVKQEAVEQETSLGAKRKRGDPDAVDSKEGVLSKRPRPDSEPAVLKSVKQEPAVKTET